MARSVRQADAKSACGNRLWKTIDVKAAAGSDDVGDCETSCSFKFPGAGNLAGIFSLMKAKNLKLCPKSAKLAPPQGTIRESREFRPNPPARLELQVLFLESEYLAGNLTGNPGPYRAVAS